MSWNQQKKWGPPSPAWKYWHQKPVKNQNTGKGKGKGGSVFPSYDTTKPLPSSSSAGQQEEKEVGVKKALSALLKANQLTIPEELLATLQEDGMEEIKQEQRSLNQRKRAYQKLERLKRAKGQKKQQWEIFRSDLHKHLNQEMEKYQKDLAEIDAAIAKAQKDIDAIESRQALEAESTEDLENLLEGDAEIRSQLESAQKQNAEYEARLRQMSQQLQAYASSSTTPTPLPAEKEFGTSSPQQGQKMKEIQEEKDKKARTERQARIKQVEDMMKLQNPPDRERSPRRESQESHGDLGSLG